MSKHSADTDVAFIQALLAGIVMMLAGIPAVGIFFVLALILGIAQVPVILVTGPAIAYMWSAGDHGTLVNAERADAVAGAQEGEVTRHHVVEQRLELRFDAVLHGGLLLIGVGGVERSAADEDARPVVQVDPPERLRLQPSPHQLVFAQARVPQEELVLLVGRHVFGAGGEQQERLHEASTVVCALCTDAMYVVMASSVAATAGLRGPSSRATAQ